jgi:hypothetical protein
MPAPERLKPKDLPVAEAPAEGAAEPAAEGEAAAE